ncbi:MAG TPA: porin family protein [Chitinophagaceae bacterium]
MKLFILSIATLLSFFAANSQVQFGLLAGAQATSADYTIGGKKQETSYKPGGQVGVNFKIPIEGRLSFAPQLFYSMKGYKVKYNRFMYPPDGDAIDNNTTFHNVELALPLQYDFSYSASHWFLRAGPSLDFQLFGREEFTTNSNGKIKRNIPFGYDKYGHYSANAVLHFGYEKSNGFFIYGQYTHGLANISNTDEGPKIRHRAFGISFGKFIKKSKIVLDTRPI